MTNPITPPPDLVQEWIDEPQYMTEDQLGKRMNLISMNEVRFREIIDKVSQYGADQKLEACCELLDINGCPSRWIDMLRAARRPKPPTLKEQALNDLDDIPTHDDEGRQVVDLSNIRRALEALPQ